MSTPVISLLVLVCSMLSLASVGIVSGRCGRLTGGRCSACLLICLSLDSCILSAVAAILARLVILKLVMFDLSLSLAIFSCLVSAWVAQGKLSWGMGRHFALNTSHKGDFHRQE